MATVAWCWRRSCRSTGRAANEWQVFWPLAPPQLVDPLKASASSASLQGVGVKADKAPASVSIEALKAVELEKIRANGPPDAADSQPWGLALSGGGIRSATFSLGVLQALSENGLLRLFHYQSTVSGGGYIGAFLQSLIHRRGLDEAMEVLRARLDDRVPPDDPDPEATRLLMQGRRRPIQHLREYSNYLSPRKSLVSGDTMAMVGTVVRNALLIQIQLVALFLAASLMPLLLYWALDAYAFGGSTSKLLVLSATCCALGFVLLGYVTSDAKRVGTPGRKAGELAAAAKFSTPMLAAAALFMAMGTVLMVVGNSTGMPWLTRTCAYLTQSESPSSCFLGFSGQLGSAAAALYLVIWVAWWALTIAHWDSSANGGKSTKTFAFRFLLATLIAAAFAGLAAAGAAIASEALLKQVGAESAHALAMLALIWGPSVIMVLFAVTCTIHQGLAGPTFDDLQREIWARVGGKTAAATVLFISVPLTLTIIGPWAMMRVAHGHDLWAAWAGGLTWVATTGVGLFAAFGKSESEKGKPTSGRWLGVIAKIAPWVFILGLLLGVSLAGQLLAAQVRAWTDRPAADLGLLPYLSWLHENMANGNGALSISITAIIAVVIWSVLGRFVNINDFGLNSFYRNRLVRCYLGATNDARSAEATTNFDPRDDLPLATVIEPPPGSPPGPRPLYPLIGATLNLVATKMLDWQDRKAASFVLSPRFCGHIPPTSRADKRSIGDVEADPVAAHIERKAPAPLAASVSYGSAVAISGAAVSPTMGYHSSTAVTFLLALFNVRLGWWLANPSHSDRPGGDKTPFSARWLLLEMFGLTDGLAKFVHLSDGGHFENLALYELVRRRCRLIVCVDAGADPDRDFSDLANAVQKCRVDFGAQISIDVSPMRPTTGGLAKQGYAIGSIVYADSSPGTIVYIKPSLTGREPTDIENYAHLHGRFPHEPTSDQYFSEAQFECYRRLGEYLGTIAFIDLLKLYPVADLASGKLVPDAALRKRLVDALEAAGTPG